MKSSRELRTFARRMKREPPFHEMWFAHRLQESGISFKTQVTVGFYIVDFLLPDQMLVVEIDGSMHNESYDKRRDEFLDKCGFRVLRVANGDVGSVDIGAITSAVSQPASVLKSALCRAKAFRGVALRANREVA